MPVYGPRKNHVAERETPPPAMYTAVPMRWLTLLAVEDSRFAAEALRLMCRKLGLRLRRAEDLRQAKHHLALYRPDIVLVDLGLPDGRGETLIRRLVDWGRRPDAVLAMSGDPAGRETAMAAGADAFIDKPLENLESFRSTLVSVLPEFADRIALAPLRSQPPEPPVAPDRLALHDDLVRAAKVLRQRADAEGRRYLAGFLGGVARHAHDAALAEAVRGAGEIRGDCRLKTLLERRLAASETAFGGPAHRR